MKKMQPIKIGVIVSRFNQDITNGLYESALGRLREVGLAETNITSVFVPGAVEIPLVAQRLAVTAAYDVIICLGAVIQGDTKHFDYVCEQVSQGCQQVALETEVPIIFGVLTTDNEEQAVARMNKGSECVDAAIEMVSVLRQIDER